MKRLITFYIYICIIVTLSLGGYRFALTAEIHNEFAVEAKGKVFGNLSEAISQLGENGGRILIKKPQILMDFTIPHNIKVEFVDEGSLVIPKGKTVNIQGKIESLPRQIFYGEGVVVFSKGGIQRVYPQWWGAKGDGQTDDTRSIQASINALQISGGTVFLLPGTYRANDISLHSNIKLIGQYRDTAILSHIAGMGPGKVESLVGINQYDGGTADPANNSQNIEISNITFLGAVVEDGFSEHHHLLFITAASHVNIHDCRFKAFQGDGIYIGQRGRFERHNENIKIVNCTFDGVNNDNRNGISVTDGTNISIEQNVFVNCTRKNMPGNIDIEPNYEFDRVQDISIKANKFSRYYGSKGAIGFYFSKPLSGYLYAPKRFLIENNYIDIDYHNAGARAQNAIILYAFNQAVTDETPEMEITIRGNKIYNDVRLLGINGVLFEDNIISTNNGYCMMGSITDSNGHHNLIDAVIRNNVFDKTGNWNGALSIGNASNISIYGNTFTRIPSNGIVLSGYKAKTKSDGISIYENKFVGPMAHHIMKQPLHCNSRIHMHDNWSDNHAVAPSVIINGL